MKEYRIVRLDSSSSSSTTTPRQDCVANRHIANKMTYNLFILILTYCLLIVEPISANRLTTNRIGLNNRTSSSSSPINKNRYPGYRVIYQAQLTESSLPVCKSWTVCNTVDTYQQPWIEKQCRCPGKVSCSMSFEPSDGNSITDKSRHYKLCEPTRTLRKCRYFRDVAWTTIVYPNTSRQQIMHCICPKNSVAYILKTHSYRSNDEDNVHRGDGITSQYSYACSPRTRLRCKRKEPCRLFTVKKLKLVDAANYDTLCQCRSGYKCPDRHTDHGVIYDITYSGRSTRVYSGYCIKSTMQ